MKRELTGKHVLLIALGAFGVIVAANLAMLFAATGSFPGLVVDNSYVASQGWNTRVAEQKALGWTVEISYRPGTVEVDLRAADGAPVRGQALILTVGRPASDADDVTLKSQASATGYRFAADLAPGQWRLELKTASGPEFATRAELLVPGDG